MKRISIGIVLAAQAFLLVSASVPASKPPVVSGDGALRGLVIGHASGVHAAVSALKYLDEGDVESARLMLQTELTSGLTVMYSVLDEAKSQAKPEEIRLIDETIREAEAYAAKKKLKVIRPAK